MINEVNTIIDVVNSRTRWSLASSCSDLVANQANIMLDERALSHSRLFLNDDHTILKKAYVLADKHT